MADFVGLLLAKLLVRLLEDGDLLIQFLGIDELVDVTYLVARLIVVIVIPIVAGWGVEGGNVDAHGFGVESATEFFDFTLETNDGVMGVYDVLGGLRVKRLHILDLFLQVPILFSQASILEREVFFIRIPWILLALPEIQAFQV